MAVIMLPEIVKQVCASIPVVARLPIFWAVAFGIVALVVLTNKQTVLRLNKVTAPSSIGLVINRMLVDIDSARNRLHDAVYPESPNWESLEQVTCYGLLFVVLFVFGLLAVQTLRIVR